MVPGIHAFGVLLFDGAGRVFVAIGLASAAQNFPRRRFGAVEEVLRVEACKIMKDDAETIRAPVESAFAPRSAPRACPICASREL